MSSPTPRFRSELIAYLCVFELLLGGSEVIGAAAPGSADTAFQAAIAPKAMIERMVTAPDGTLYVSGDALATVGGTNRDVVRLQASGAVDPNFQADVGAYSHSIQLDGAGRLVVWTTFEIPNPNSTPSRPLPPLHSEGLVRLNADGARDTSFKAGTSAGGPAVAYNGIAVDDAGRILLMGAFYTSKTGPYQSVARLLESGALDGAFVPATAPTWHFNQRYESVNPSDGGMVVFAGSVFRYGADGALVFNSADEGFLSGFITADGRIVAASATGVKCFLQDGSADPGFVELSGASGIAQIAQGPGGKIVIVGSSGVLRLNSDGTADAQFQAPSLQGLKAVAVDPLGNIYTGPYFGTVGGTVVNGVLRLNGGLEGAVSLDPIPAADESAGARTITLRRLGDRSAAVSVELQTGTGSATTGVDYQAVTQTVEFAAGQETATVEIPIMDDAEIETAEIIPVSLRSETAVLANPARRGVALAAESGGTIALPAGPIHVHEEDGFADIVLTRTGGTEGPAQVRFAIREADAVAGRDFLPMPDITIPSGASTFTARLRLLDNVLQNFTRGVRIKIESLTPAAAVAPDQELAVIIALDSEKASASTYAGLYRGLYEVNGAPALLTIALSRSGALTGALRTRSGVIPVHGTFNGAGRVTLTIARNGASPLVRQTFYLSGAGPGRAVTGVQDSEARTLYAMPAFSTAAPAAGSYTFTLPPRSGETQGQSRAWASAHVLATGAVTIVGRLADGTPFASAGRLSGDAHCAVFTPLYDGAGSLLFELAFTLADDGSKSLTGTGRWTRGNSIDEQFTVSGRAFTRAVAEALASQTLAYTRSGLASPATLAPLPPRVGALVFSDGNVLLRIAGDGRFTGQEGRGKAALFFSGAWLVPEAVGAGTTVGAAARRDVLLTPVK